MTSRIQTLAGVAILALSLTACGKVGQLERPGPLFGQERNTTKDADNAERTAQDPSRPVDTVDPRDRSTDPAPPRTLPIPGTNRGPNAPPPAGGLPDPFTNPR
jgi:predicted small lipoprotein YifL